jgi:formylglycine-generating enzyme required for sulfatase activity
MVLIPAGWFMIGNSIADSDILDATPTNVYVSSFFMDMNLVTLSQWQTIYSNAIASGYYLRKCGAGKAYRSSSTDGELVRLRQMVQRAVGTGRPDTGVLHRCRLRKMFTPTATQERLFSRIGRQMAIGCRRKPSGKRPLGAV